MNKENKINAILNIVANKEPEYDVFEFIELDNNDNEIKREVLKFPVRGSASSRLEIGISSKCYQNTKTNILNLREELSK